MSITPRNGQMMALIVSGLLNKQWVENSNQRDPYELTRERVDESNESKFPPRSGEGRGGTRACAGRFTCQQGDTMINTQSTQAFTVRVNMSVNGVALSFAVEPRTTLLDALRDEVGLTGPKKSCDRGECGACTVHVDGRRVLSCMTLAACTMVSKSLRSKD